MDYKPEDLEVWDEKICKIAKEKYSLDWFPIEYELIDYYSMIAAMTFHGLPSHFNHWSFGKSFERTHHMYNLGMEGLPYELILNSNPSLAYLMRENDLYLQILIMAHCVGHSDFFKNNRTFRFTRPETIHGRCRAAKKRFQDYVENPNIGIEKVEEVIDACYALQFQSPRPDARRRTRQEIINDYIDQKRDCEKRGVPFKSIIDLDKKVLEPDYDILGFISENGEMPDWKRDIIDVCRDEAQYFWPQMMTKVMNEGWASIHHYDILHDLDLPPDLHIPFVKSHNQVIRPHIGGINPYHLGFHIFKDIEKRLGRDEILLAREVHNDSSFIRQYLTEELCVELNLFSYAKRNSGTYIEEVSDKDGWKIVRDDLAKQVAGGSIPIIKVYDTKWDGTLMLEHEHDGRDMLISETESTLSHIKTLWGKPVYLRAKIGSDTQIFTR